MKHTLLALLLSIPLFTGCKSVPSPTDLQRIQTAAKVAAYVGTHQYLQENPGDAQKFSDVASALEILATSDTIDYLTLIAAVNKLPIKELKSPEAQLAITSATIILSDYAGTLPVGQTETLKPIAKSIAAGIRLGLQ